MIIKKIRKFQKGVRSEAPDISLDALKAFRRVWYESFLDKFSYYVIVPDASVWIF